MNPAKRAFARTKNFVVKNKTAIAVGVTVAVTAVAMHKLRGGALNSHTEFLNERGLADDYINWITENTEV